MKGVVISILFILHFELLNLIGFVSIGRRDLWLCLWHGGSITTRAGRTTNIRIPQQACFRDAYRSGAREDIPNPGVYVVYSRVKGEGLSVYALWCSVH